jgi:hypothetical protein
VIPSTMSRKKSPKVGAAHRHLGAPSFRHSASYANLSGNP